MIVDSPVNFGLTLGQDRRIPQDDDAQVIIPASILPVVLALQTHKSDDAIVPTAAQSVSVIAGTTLTQAPSAAEAQSDIIILAPGLWELELTLSSWFNFTPAAPATRGASIVMLYQATTMFLLDRWTQSGSFTDFNRLRFLLSSQAIVSLIAGATGAAQNNSSRAIVNAIRIL